MTEKQGNMKQNNLNYIHTVINIKKKIYKNKVKNKQEIQNRSNFSKCLKEKKSRAKNRATRELTLVILAFPCYIVKPFLGILLTVPSYSTLAVLSHPRLIKLLASIPSSHPLSLLKHRCMTPSLNRAPTQLGNGITLLPKSAIHTLCHLVLLDIMVGVVAG